MKTILKSGMICLIVLAGIAIFSCTDGEFKGKGGGGNLNIVGMPSEYNNKYLSVETAVGVFNPERIKIKSGKVKAPLYSGGVKYESSGNITVTAKVWDSLDAVTTSTTKTFSVKFFGGSGLVDWR